MLCRVGGGVEHIDRGRPDVRLVPRRRVSRDRAVEREIRARRVEHRGTLDGVVTRSRLVVKRPVVAVIFDRDVNPHILLAVVEVREVERNRLVRRRGSQKMRRVRLRQCTPGRDAVNARRGSGRRGGLARARSLAAYRRPIVGRRFVARYHDRDAQPGTAVSVAEKRQGDGVDGPGEIVVRRVRRLEPVRNHARVPAHGGELARCVAALLECVVAVVKVLRV